MGSIVLFCTGVMFWGLSQLHGGISMGLDQFQENQPAWCFPEYGDPLNGSWGEVFEEQVQLQELPVGHPYAQMAGEAT